MKKLLTFLMLSVLAIGVGWAEESVYKTLTFSAETNSQGVNNYTSTWYATVDGFRWDLKNFSNNNNGWAYVKAGTKSSASVATISTNTVIDKSISKVAVTVDAFKTNYINSAKLYVASDANFTSDVQTIALTVEVGTMTYTIPTPTKNMYYKLEYDCKQGTNSTGNGLITISKVEYFTNEVVIPTVAKPTFSVASGNYASTQSVTINCETENATIHYGTDGVTFEEYDGLPISISETTTLFAYATKEGMIDSEVASANYVIQTPAEPGDEVMFDYRTGAEFAQSDQSLMVMSSKNGITIDFAKGTGSTAPTWYENANGDVRLYAGNTLTVNTGELDLTIEKVIFTYDGSNPLTGPEVSLGSFNDGVWTLGATTGVLTVASGNKPRIATITVKLADAGTIIVTPPTISGTTPFNLQTEVTITAEEGATIYYTTDGENPTTASTQYTEPFTITETTTVKSIAVVDGVSSAVAEKIFTAIPTIGNIEDFNALELGDNFKYTASNLVAIKQYETTSTSGNKNYYLYAQNGEKGMLIFGNTGQTYQPGDVIPGGFTGTRAVFNGAPEMTNPAGFTASSQNVGLTPVEITPSQVNLDNFGRYAIIKNASFNTTNKIITAGDEEIPYHTTFMTPPTDGAVYDVIGICGYYKPQNGTAYPQFLPISFEPAEVTGAEYYLAGSFTNWAQDDTYKSYKFTKLANGDYKLNKTIADDVLFKVLKVEGEDVTWLGGGADGDYFGITKDVCTNISLVDGKNFYMAAGGNCTFTVSADQKLTVSKEAQLFMKGSYSNDDWSTKTPLEATNTGWTITMDFDANTQFGFVDEWGNWHGGNGYLIKAEHMGDEIPMVGNGNYVFENASNYTLNINSELTKLVVTDNNVVIEGDYVKVTSNDQLTSGIYLIVYEDGSLAFDGGLETLDAVGNSIEVEISDNVIPASTEVDAAAFTYDALAGTLKSASGYYIGQTSDANGLKASQTTVYTNTLSIDDDGNADVVSQGGAYLRYNATSGQTRFRYFKSDTYTSQKAIQLYKKGGEIVPTLDAPEIEGETPFEGSTTVTITAEEGAAIYYTINGDTPSSESILYEEPFELSESATVKAIAIKGDLVSSVASKSFEKKPEISSATAFYRYEGTGEFVFTGNLVAIAQTGKYLYAQDDAKGVLIYGQIDQAYQKGDKIPAGFHAKKGAYHGAPQMTDPTGFQEATEQVTIQPVELTIAQASLDTQDNLYRYAVIKEVKYEDGNLVAGDNSLFVYADRFETNLTPVEGKTYNVTGIVGWHDDAQFMPLEYELVQVPVVLEGVAFTSGPSGRKWATWYGDANLSLPEGVAAYVVTGVNGTTVTTAEVTYIPAETAVLLYSEEAAETVSALPYTGETSTVPTNKLEGTLEPATVSDAYVLYDNQFILAQDGTTVGAHRCYLPMTSETQGAPRLLIGDPGTVTGIEDLRYDSNGKPVGYYDLIGRYVGTSLNGKRGIFITSDGKKVVR